jgi:hypothetical protein
MGNNKPAHGLLMYDSENIPIKEANPYKVTLNLRHQVTIPIALKKCIAYVIII